MPSGYPLHRPPIDSNPHYHEIQSRIFTLLLSLLMVQAFAHLGTLTGIVFDGSTHLPLRGVTVQLVGLGKATT